MRRLAAMRGVARVRLLHPGFGQRLGGWRQAGDVGERRGDVGVRGVGIEPRDDRRRIVAARRVDGRDADETFGVGSQGCPRKEPLPRRRRRSGLRRSLASAARAACASAASLGTPAGGKRCERRDAHSDPRRAISPLCELGRDTARRVRPRRAAPRRQRPRARHGRSALVAPCADVSDSVLIVLSSAGDAGRQRIEVARAALPLRRALYCSRGFVGALAGIRAAATAASACSRARLCAATAISSSRRFSRGKLNRPRTLICASSAVDAGVERAWPGPDAVPPARPEFDRAARQIALDARCWVRAYRLGQCVPRAERRRQTKGQRQSPRTTTPRRGTMRIVQRRQKFRPARFLAVTAASGIRRRLVRSSISVAVRSMVGGRRRGVLSGSLVMLSPGRVRSNSTARLLSPPRHSTGRRWRQQIGPIPIKTTLLGRHLAPISSSNAASAGWRATRIEAAPARSSGSATWADRQKCAGRKRACEHARGARRIHIGLGAAAGEMQHAIDDRPPRRPRPSAAKFRR